MGIGLITVELQGPVIAWGPSHFMGVRGSRPTQIAPALADHPRSEVRHPEQLSCCFLLLSQHDFCWIGFR